ncbi:PAS domain S-box protein [Kaistia granuli]|uniref:PAS domain S-box protein n=1 Tax=Kaistia granuli TaxID=363259 RepID=UPI00039C7F6D|nr:PAS domain S-box protein [Kaistia granuli]
MGSAFDTVATTTPVSGDDGDGQEPVARLTGSIGGVINALPAAIYTVDAAGRLTSFNEAAAVLWGRRPALYQEEWCGSWRLFRSDGTPLPHAECPMAVALREGRAIAGAEAMAERPDGSRVSFLAYPTPLRDAEGRITGAVNMLVDVTERKVGLLSEARLSAIVESSHDAIISKDLNGIIATWNNGAQALFGYTAEEAIGQPMTLIIPPDRLQEEPAILDRIRSGELVDHFETVRRRKDGSLVDISLTISPVRDLGGRIVGASKIARDISERRLAEQQQQLILREMSHRIKNLFAIAGSIVSMNARVASSAAELAQSVRQRLDALTRAHALTRPGLLDDDASADRDTSVRGLLDAILLPYLAGETGSGKVILKGEDLPVGGAAVSNLALVFNEFATNAAKYGALTADGGQVVVSWTVEGDKLRVLWRESGGPPIEQEPLRRGFGSTLADRIIIGQLGGTLYRDWQPDGLRITLELDRQRLG